MFMEEEEAVCEYCNGTGFVTNVVFDKDSYSYVADGLIECNHPGYVKETSNEEVY
jgi:hypothetical protein